MDLKTEAQLRKEISDVWGMLHAERAGAAALALQADAEIARLRALVLDYAVACGELSKSLNPGDPMWAELEALGERIPPPPKEIA